MPVYENCELSVQLLPAPEVLTAEHLLLCVRWWDQAEWVYGPVKEIVVKSTDTVQVRGCCGRHCCCTVYVVLQACAAF
jgi:hypothetical protein